MITDVKRLSGLQKVAILFTILGEGLSITLLKELSKTDIRKVRSVARDMDSVSFGVKKQVIEQFYYSFVSEKFQAEEGGEDEPKKPFEFLDDLTDEQLISMVLPEDTKVKAIVMAQVSAEKRKKVLDRLDPEEKGRVLIEMGTLNEVPLEAIVSVASDLQEKSHFLPKTVDFSRGGGKEVAEMLGEMEPDDESKYLEAISREAPALADEIKKYHLKWEDIFEFFPDNIIRDLMNSVELDLIAMGMKGMDEAVISRVIENLPQKKQAMYEPIEGAVSKREVDNARKGIVQAAKQMEKDGAFNLEDYVGGGEMVE
jgi:flagellar motor switch protein FliG